MQRIPGTLESTQYPSLNATAPRCPNAQNRCSNVKTVGVFSSDKIRTWTAINGSEIPRAGRAGCGFSVSLKLESLVTFRQLIEIIHFHDILPSITVYFS